MVDLRSIFTMGKRQPREYSRRPDCAPGQFLVISINMRAIVLRHSNTVAKCHISGGHHHIDYTVFPHTQLPQIPSMPIKLQAWWRCVAITMETHRLNTQSSAWAWSVISYSNHQCESSVRTDSKRHGDLDPKDAEVNHVTDGMMEQVWGCPEWLVVCLRDQQQWRSPCQKEVFLSHWEKCPPLTSKTIDPLEHSGWSTLKKDFIIPNSLRSHGQRAVTVLCLQREGEEHKWGRSEEIWAACALACLARQRGATDQSHVGASAVLRGPHTLPLPWGVDCTAFN